MHYGSLLRVRTLRPVARPPLVRFARGWSHWDRDATAHPLGGGPLPGGPRVGPQGSLGALSLPRLVRVARLGPHPGPGTGSFTRPRVFPARPTGWAHGRGNLRAARLTVGPRVPTLKRSSTGIIRLRCRGQRTAHPWDYNDTLKINRVSPGTRLTTGPRVPTLKHPSAGLKRWGPAATRTARPWDYNDTLKKKTFCWGPASPLVPVYPPLSAPRRALRGGVPRPHGPPAPGTHQYFENKR